MRSFIQLFSFVLVSILISSQTINSLDDGGMIRLPLSKRVNGRGTHRLYDRDGNDTGVVDMEALRRSIDHVSRRYGGNQEGEGMEKRWVKGNVLNKPIDFAFSKGDDDVQNSLLGGIKGGLEQMMGKILPSNSVETEDKGIAKSKSIDRSSKAKGRYTGASGNTIKSVSLKDNVSGGTDIEYVCNIQIGTPPQTFPIDPDTGSADLWVVDQSCQASNCGPNSRGKYQNGKSSSFATIQNSPAFDLHYGIGDVSGSYARETVTLAGVTVNKQTIGLANQTSPDWKDDLASGVLGLGFRSITSNNQRPFIQNLASQGKLKYKEIGFAFGRAASNTQGKSQMTIGGSDKSLYKGKISFYGLTKIAYWQTSYKQFSAGSNSGVQNLDGIFDTGTSLIATPSNLASSFWKGVPGSALSNDGSYYTYPCNQNINAKLTMPDGRSFTFSESDMNLGKESSGSSKCVGAIVSANTPGQIIFGLAAMKNMYTIFDFGNNRIGFANYSF